MTIRKSIILRVKKVGKENYSTETFTNDKENEYFTAVGVAGELILYRITLHQMLSAKSDPVIWKVWSQYQWLDMEHTEVEVEDEE